MAKVNLGEKLICPECEKKFYDLTKVPALCPYCGTSFDPSRVEKPAPIIVVKAKTEKPAKPDPKDNDPDDADDATNPDEDEDGDLDDSVAKELELDGDASSFLKNTDSEDDDEGPKNSDLAGFSNANDDDEDAAILDDEEDDVLPPTEKEGEEPEEVEI